MTPEELKALLELDTEGLLDVKAKSSPITQDEKLISTFEEINKFIDENNREPNKDGDVAEFSLACRLDGIRKNPNKIAYLKQYDRHSLLGEIKDANGNSLADLVGLDEFGLLDDDATGIHNLVFVTEPKPRADSDFTARRKPCPNFEKYEPLFKKCQEEISSGKRYLEKFNEHQIVEGQFFVSNGVLLYVDTVHALEKNNSTHKFDGRTKIIFENGKMSNMLFRSLGKQLFINGQHVSDDNFKMGKDFEMLSGGINSEDKPTGRIYILSSKSKDSTIKSIKNLFKIGYTETSVEDRIKNAEREPTYLMAPVKVIASYETYNMNAQKFEDLLHRFFSDCRVGIDVYDSSGNRHTVREWFQIPFDDIEEAITLLISEEIINYKYERGKGILLSS